MIDIGPSVLFAIGWLVLVIALGAIALPLTTSLFPTEPSRGAAFAIPLGLAALTLLTYWLGRIVFPIAPLIAVFLLAGIAFASLRHGPSLPRRAYAESAIVFTIGFLLVVAVRATNPDIIANAELYWNFGLLQSLLRTSHLPPIDPWFAGESVRYYYGGHLLSAALALLGDTPGPIAYNLALAVFFGALTTASYGVASAIAASYQFPPRTAGALGAFFTVIASNLVTPLRLILTVLPDTIANPLAQVLGLTPGQSLATWYSFIDATHFTFTNTDFPMYTVFIGGLHPHMMSPVFLLLTIGFLVAYFQLPREAISRRIGLLIALTPLVGLIALTDTWSLPTACGLIAVSVALAPTHPASFVMQTGQFATDPGRRWVTRGIGGLIVGLLAGLIGILWVSPYFLRGLAGDPRLGVLPARSAFWFFILGYGGFLLVFAPYLIWRLRGALSTPTGRTFAIVTVISLGLISVIAGFPGLVLLGPVLIGGWFLSTTDRAGFDAVLLVAGAGLALLVELVYVREAAEPGRYNTVYKTYTQVWVIWAPAAGVALTSVYHNTDTRLSTVNWRPVVAVLLVVSLSLYGIVGFGSFLGTVPGGVDQAADDLSLDGLRYLEIYHPDHAAAIAWLSSHEGQPTIVSAPIPQHRAYRFEASTAASLTGIPTLVGWDHEADYRGWSEYQRRVAVVDSIYTGPPDVRARLLTEYQVQYIWVGVEERARYPDQSLRDDPRLSVAFNRGNITIYSVTYR